MLCVCLCYNNNLSLAVLCYAIESKKAQIENIGERARENDEIREKTDSILIYYGNPTISIE